MRLGVFLSFVLFGVHVSAIDKPNVLFIAIDDLNDWVGCMEGHPNALTPNIDALAKRGLLFTNAHCQAPICGPSRASLMTGMLPTTTGIYGQISDKNLRKASKAVADAKLLPDYFEEHGYRTLAAGKLFHGGDGNGAFDDYGPKNSFGPKPPKRFKYDPAWFPEKMGGTQTDWGAYPEADSEMPDFKIAAYGVKQLATQHDQPFFLALGFMRPHVPWYVPQEWFDLHPSQGVELPPYLPDDLADVPELSRRVNELPAMPTTEWAIKNDEWRNIVQAYLACTTFVDAQVGKVLDALEKSDHASDTIVVLWSDHGYHIGEKNRFAKQALWDRANKVPLIVATPNANSAGKTTDAAVGLIDLYPTLLELCGLPANPTNEGRSLVELIRNPVMQWPHTVITSYGPGNHAIQSQTHRFYQYADGSRELYDHQMDPNEWHNLAGKAHFQSLMDKLAADVPNAPAPVASNVTFPTNLYFQGLTAATRD
ncbi:MAG: sulfatase [Planctomycetota bacterium]